MRAKQTYLILLYILLIISALQTITAAHYIVGKVNNAIDGTPADFHTVIVWNPVNGISDNITDIIGITGNSKQPNTYMIDCELLRTPCRASQDVNVKVMNNGDNHFTRNISVKITGKASDKAADLTLNTPPNISLNSPSLYQNYSSRQVLFNCTAIDPDSNLRNLSLFGNWSSWHMNETRTSGGASMSQTFFKNLSDGAYTWNCLGIDDLGVYSYAPYNFSFNLDATPPSLYSLSINESFICGDSHVLVNCSANDSLSGISNVIVQVMTNNGYSNHTAFFGNGNSYYADIFLDQNLNYTFNCIVNDSYGNSVNMTTISYEHHPIDYVDFAVYSKDMNLSIENPIENQLVNIGSIIYNNGCMDHSLLVGFFNGNPFDNGRQIGNNITINIQKRKNSTISIDWMSEIGSSNIFLLLDTNNTFLDSNISNNIANRSLNITSWQVIFGNVSLDRLLANNRLSNFTRWENMSYSLGNIFVSDSEARIDWLKLHALSFDLNNNSVFDDFAELDSFFGMVGYSDSLYNMYTDSGTPKEYKNFTFQESIVYNVPVINSTNTSDFKTGILWDFSDDQGNLQYDGGDKEDIVFVSEINKKKQGLYGTYDYEIAIPARLRQYNSTDTSALYLYYDLV